TVNADTVTLVAGKDVLEASDFGTYNNFSDLTRIIDFGNLTSGASSYSEGAFRVSSTGRMNLNNQITNAVAPSTATDQLTLRTSNGDLFALYGVSLSGTGSVTFTGTTADGKTVTQTFQVSSTTGFENFVLPASFTGLTSVSWVPGSTTLLTTYLVATVQ